MSAIYTTKAVGDNLDAENDLDESNDGNNMDNGNYMNDVMHQIDQGILLNKTEVPFNLTDIL